MSLSPSDYAGKVGIVVRLSRDIAIAPHRHAAIPQFTFVAPRTTLLLALAPPLLHRFRGWMNPVDATHARIQFYGLRAHNTSSDDGHGRIRLPLDAPIGAIKDFMSELVEVVEIGQDVDASGNDVRITRVHVAQPLQLELAVEEEAAMGATLFTSYTMSGILHHVHDHVMSHIAKAQVGSFAIALMDGASEEERATVVQAMLYLHTPAEHAAMWGGSSNEEYNMLWHQQGCVVKRRMERVGRIAMRDDVLVCLAIPHVVMYEERDAERSPAIPINAHWSFHKVAMADAPTFGALLWHIFYDEVAQWRRMKRSRPYTDAEKHKMKEGPKYSLMKSIRQYFSGQDDEDDDDDDGAKKMLRMHKFHRDYERGHRGFVYQIQSLPDTHVKQRIVFCVQGTHPALEMPTNFLVEHFSSADRVLYITAQVVSSC